jgi:hypothetical protein
MLLYLCISSHGIGCTSGPLFLGTEPDAETCTLPIRRLYDTRRRPMKNLLTFMHMRAIVATLFRRLLISVRSENYATRVAPNLFLRETVKHAELRL